MRILRSCFLWLACVVPVFALAAAAKAPTVMITSPANGASFKAPASVTLTATATATGATITKVDFYRGGTTLIGTATTAPYTITWTGAAAGSYSLTAKATSSAGGVGTSTAVNITVTNSPPTVSLTAPASGATYSAPATINLAANASDSDGNVQRVDFYSGANFVASSTSAPFTATWSNVSAGSYSLTAKATDNGGAQTTSSPVTVSVTAANVPPLIAISSPDNCGPFSAAGGVSLSADAVDPDGFVSRVDFSQGGTLIGSIGNPNVYADTRNAYSMTWNPPEGTYTVTATAYDNKGASTASAPITITVVTPPAVTIIAPAGGSTWAIGSSVAITATATGGSSSGSAISKVDFYAGGTLVGTSTSAPYSATWRPTSGGNYSISATATDAAGFSTSSQSVFVTVNSAPPPTVSLTSPQSGATVLVNQSVPLAASATSSSGTITKVEFYAGAALVGTATAAPYTGSWMPATAGAYSLTAKAYDGFGASTVSAPATVVASATPPPTVTLTAPAAGNSFVVNQSLALSASAAASGSASITKVDFFAGVTFVGTATSAPYTASWTPTTSGSYSLTAKATDSFGGATTSTPVSVTVQAGPPPVVNLTSPVINSTFSSSGNVTLSANAAPASGGAAIAKVEFFQNGTSIGVATVAPYTVTWPTPAPGTYSVTAVATDALGISASTGAVQVTVINSPPPTVTLTGPSAGTTYAAPANITLTATASAASGASIAKVDFYQDSMLVGTASSAPYLVTWSRAAVGTYSLTAVATDSYGVQTQTAPVSVTVGTMTVAFTSPQNGAALTGTSVIVQGTFHGPANAGLTINGAVAAVDSQNNFYANVPLQAGGNAITATVTASTGQTQTQTINVTSDGAAPFLTVVASTNEAVGPVTVTYTLSNSSATDAAVNFGGSQLTVPAGQSVNFTGSYSGTGAFLTTVAATDGSGNSTTQTLLLMLDDPVKIDQQLQAAWNDMNAALINGDKPTAMNYLSPGAQSTYGPVFDALMPDMASIVASFSTRRLGTLSSELGEYAITRNLDGVTNVFFVYFVKDANGVWRLDSM
jgi:hypothetical protein